MSAHHQAARAAAPDISAQSDDGAEPEEVEDYNNLRRLLSGSPTRDAYCRSVFYFALTGRRKVWMLRHKDGKYLVLVPHPNVDETLLVFCPFISSASELVEQVEALCKFQEFLNQFQEIFLARIPQSIAESFSSDHETILTNCKLQHVDEKRLDWVYPSYDIDLQRLLNPDGGKLRTYRKKIRKFCSQNIEVLRPRDLSPKELSRVVLGINKGWVRTKLKSRNSHQILGMSFRELMSCYRAMADLNRDPSLAMDGLILKRGEDYLAFSFWERPAPRRTVACLAALPVSHEKGLSEYLYHIIAECLQGQGYEDMCIGGSETDSLDQFKKKLDPSRIHKLRTIKISPRNRVAHP